MNEFEGVKYDDPAFAHEILSGRCYEVAEPTELGLKNIWFHANEITRRMVVEPSRYREGDLFIDIGGYSGIWSALVGCQYPKSRGVVIEPLPVNISRIDKTLKLNNLRERFEPIQAAVGFGAQTEICFGYGDLMGYEIHQSAPGPSLMVESWSLGRILAYCRERFQSDHVYILKIDCEGGEYGFFETATIRELSRIAWIVGEYHHGIWDRFHNKLIACGFSVLTGEWEHHALFKYVNPLWH